MRKVLKCAGVGIGLFLWGYFVVGVVISVIDRLWAVFDIVERMAREDRHYGDEDFDNFEEDDHQYFQYQ